VNTEELLKPNETEKSASGKYWKDFYCLNPGKYVIVEVNVDNMEDVEIKNHCIYKCLTVFTKEDYLSNKRKQFPDANMIKFMKMYNLCGLEITEWNEHIPNYIKLTYDIPKIREEYNQPKEVEDTLSSLLEEDTGKKSTVSFLSEIYDRPKPKKCY
jgi:hypothetical protein